MYHSAGEVDNGGDYAMCEVRRDKKQEISIPPAQFCCEPETSLKNRVV